MTMFINGRPSKHTPGYISWKNMKQRCQNKNHPRFNDWGGRGIKVCERWEVFANFHADMGDKPEGMSLDRVDNTKGYCKENCRWATTTQQNNNQRVRRDSIFFEGYSVSDLCRILHCKPHTIHNRIRLGWSLPEIVDGKRIRHTA